MFNLLSKELENPDRRAIIKKIKEGLKKIEELNKKLENAEKLQPDNRESPTLEKRYSFDVIFDSKGNGSLAGTSGQYGTTGTQHVAQFMSPTTSTPVQQVNVSPTS